ncbi:MULTISPECIES: gas vesicle protein GvpJ [Streptomyces]|uniref:Gas vesicle structural protein GvpA n=1 Tax=Streptomyces fungicidicus TaxID=68203 RepID=A0ACC7Y5Y9_9ACTN|nr:MULTISPECIES: gas vesicle protein GvpJ [Streptomyces]MBF4136681.1 gas vesicle structural protein GvpA [Streptomyces albidoflavus]NUV77334.1 gas vesicle structural protein GvpA [Streptomyces fungicidicus]PBO15692.1 gas vesicle protein [Streptomyces albidoflavus]PBO21213.1 gas vesicle protein [Streptomyces albidoflavus]PBO30746.1 gas vesicle protein [Streptomyces albidoflavus]
MTTPAIYRDDLVCAPRAGTLYDTLELILDRGMVIDVFIRVSLVGIEILKIDARICVASVDTYLRFAEACNRLDLENDSHSRTVPELFGGGMAGAAGKAGAKRAASSVGGKVKGALGLDGDDDDDEADEADEERAEKPRPRKKRSSASSDRPRRRPARS